MSAEQQAKIELAQKWVKGKKTQEALMELYLMQIHNLGVLIALMEHLGLTPEILPDTTAAAQSGAGQTGRTGG